MFSSIMEISGPGLKLLESVHSTFFWQLTARNSLRIFCLCLKAHKNKLYHLWYKRQNVNQSTLSRAMKIGIGEFLLTSANTYKNCQTHVLWQYDPNLTLQRCFCIDSTTVSLSLKYLPGKRKILKRSNQIPYIAWFKR